MKKKFFRELLIIEADYVPTCPVNELDQSPTQDKIDELKNFIWSIDQIISQLK